MCVFQRMQISGHLCHRWSFTCFHGKFYGCRIPHLEQCHPERKDWGCSRCTLDKVLDSRGCYLTWFRLLVVTPWWQNIVTVAWYLFRQASTNVIGLQSRAQSPLSVTAWAQAASTKVGYSIITHWPGRLPVYLYDHSSLCQISRKLLTRRIPVTVFWVIVAAYKIMFKLKDTWKWYFTKIETHQGDNIKP